MSRGGPGRQRVPSRSRRRPEDRGRGRRPEPGLRVTGPQDEEARALQVTPIADRTGTLRVPQLGTASLPVPERLITTTAIMMTPRTPIAAEKICESVRPAHTRSSTRRYISPKRIHP